MHILVFTMVLNTAADALSRNNPSCFSPFVSQIPRFHVPKALHEQLITMHQTGLGIPNLDTIVHQLIDRGVAKSTLISPMTRARDAILHFANNSIFPHFQFANQPLRGISVFLFLELPVYQIIPECCTPSANSEWAT